jgi:glycine/D-amino acid oxidase-like deaminating enzyme
VPAEVLPWLSAAALGGPLPASTDVLVIGGGIIGMSLAHQLARGGVEVVVVDRGELNREASGTNAGSFHLQIAIHQLTGAETASASERLVAEVRLLVEAARLWHGLEAELGGSLDLHVTGGLMVAETPAQLQLLVDKQRLEEEAGLETHVLSGRELRDFAPYLAEDLAGATYCPLEGHANPLLAVPLLAARAVAEGAVVRTHAEVLGVEASARGGGPFTVTTRAGRVRARRVVNAAGAWAGELARLSGLSLPLRAEGLHVNVTEPRERVLEPLVQHIGRRLTLKQAASGTFIIGGGWPARPEAPPARYSTRWDSAAGNAAVAIRVVPLLADVRVIRTWSGVMAFTDDLSPIVGESRRVPGYHVCVVPTGFTLGPLLARRLAEQMTGAGPTLPLELSPDRAAGALPAAAG